MEFMAIETNMEFVRATNVNAKYTMKGVVERNQWIKLQPEFSGVESQNSGPCANVIISCGRTSSQQAHRPINKQAALLSLSTASRAGTYSTAVYTFVSKVSGLKSYIIRASRIHRFIVVESPPRTFDEHDPCLN